MTETKKAPANKAAPKKVSDADIVKRLTKLQQGKLSRNDRTSVTAVIRLLSE